MEMASEIKNEGLFFRNWGWFKALSGKLGTKIVETARKIKKLGQDDPRRIIHSLKFGLALTLVSLIYYFEPLYKAFGNSAMWAILTVIVVFEFSVGATLGRGLNRGLATLVAGALGFGAHYLASLAGEKGEPILLGLSVFLLGKKLIPGVVTFVRFFPQLKARYDYGLLIFMLTFCLVSISGYREDEILEMAHQRVSTILIGSSTSVFICLFVFPVWAGDDLHNLVASNLEKLGSFLEGFGVVYFEVPGDSKESNNTFMDDYKSVLYSKQSEECLIPAEFRSKIQEACTNMSLESGKALKELASAIKAMTPPSSVTPHIVKSKDAANNLKSINDTTILKALMLFLAQRKLQSPLMSSPLLHTFKALSLWWKQRSQNYFTRKQSRLVVVSMNHIMLSQLISYLQN
ncbi:aluminum-activated malate transporter 2 [Quercus suber]|uniref:Aluminum-activated malate transporter 2 n=1 Tax=Quercus suber TaxID=58331 RepID=A0AAW0IZE6_QUESU